MFYVNQLDHNSLTTSFGSVTVIKRTRCKLCVVLCYSYNSNNKTTISSKKQSWLQTEKQATLQSVALTLTGVILGCYTQQNLMVLVLQFTPLIEVYLKVSFCLFEDLLVTETFQHPPHVALNKDITKWTPPPSTQIAPCEIQHKFCARPNLDCIINLHQESLGVGQHKGSLAEKSSTHGE